MREVANRDAAQVFASLEPQRLAAVEVSGALRGELPWRSYTRLEYPQFDLCHPGIIPGPYDLVICEQVLEHVKRPLCAVQTLRRLCKKDGYLFVSTPFLVRLHGDPGDYWRFTPAGLEWLLTSQGFSVLWVRSWGNRRVVRRNLGRWARYRPWRSLRNEPDLPIIVWALAQPQSE